MGSQGLAPPSPTMLFDVVRAQLQHMVRSLVVPPPITLEELALFVAHESADGFDSLLESADLGNGFRFRFVDLIEVIDKLGARLPARHLWIVVRIGAEQRTYSLPLDTVAEA